MYPSAEDVDKGTFLGNKDSRSRSRMVRGIVEAIGSLLVER